MPHVRQAPQLHTGIILRASASEWRIGERLPAHTCEQWQLVFVLDGMVEETTTAAPLRLRAGRVLFHQPSEATRCRRWAMSRPKFWRVEFEAAGNILDAFRGCMTRAAPPESAALRQLAAAVREGWQVEADGVRLPEPAPRPEPPLGCVRLQQLYLEQALWLMARRLLRGGRRPSPRVRAEQTQNALVEAARLYMAEHIETTVPLSELCRAAGCGRAALAGGVPGPHRPHPARIQRPPCGRSTPGRCWPRAIPPARWPACWAIPPRRISRSGSAPSPAAPPPPTGGTRPRCTCATNKHAAGWKRLCSARRGSVTIKTGQSQTPGSPLQIKQ